MANGSSAVVTPKDVSPFFERTLELLRLEEGAPSQCIAIINAFDGVEWRIRGNSGHAVPSELEETIRGLVRPAGDSEAVARQLAERIASRHRAQRLFARLDLVARNLAGKSPAASIVYVKGGDAALFKKAAAKFAGGLRDTLQRVFDEAHQAAPATV